ncbi:MAG: DUF1549 domain-containing protein [Verrucomicrobia bacterium]|nr:DUF1549 domain-containing protein [Verrucomicrobiota bacterium]
MGARTAKSPRFFALFNRLTRGLGGPRSHTDDVGALAKWTPNRLFSKSSMLKCLKIVCVGLVWCLGLTAVAVESVDYNRDIRPILSANCFACHGPDENARKAKLRLDQSEAAKAQREGGPAIVPGDAGKREVVRRITSTDPDEVMPPPKSGHKLTTDQSEMITRWIREGAPYAVHWSYTPPKRPPLPTVRDTSWLRNPIDYFVLGKLEKNGMSPEPEASKQALVRRLSPDLIGLAPTL